MIRKAVYLFCVGTGFTLIFASPRCLLAETLPKTVQRLDKELTDLKVKIEKLTITDPLPLQKDTQVDIFVVPLLVSQSLSASRECEVGDYDVTIDGKSVGPDRDGPVKSTLTSAGSRITKISLEPGKSAVLGITGRAICRESAAKISCFGNRVIKPKPDEQYQAEFLVDPSSPRCNIRIGEDSVRMPQDAAPMPRK